MHSVYRTTRTVIANTNPMFGYFDSFSRLAKLLYNASLFRIRQIFTGWDKEERTANEKQVFEELETLLDLYPGLNVRRVISYLHLEKLMRVTHNPDYFSGLSAQTAQQVVRQACRNFENWLKALNDYKKNPQKYLGKPKMPGYRKSDTCTFTITNQEAVLYRSDGSCELKLPKTRERMDCGYLEGVQAQLKEVKVSPYYGRYVVSMVLETEDAHVHTDLPETAAIDFGTDNIAAIVCTDRSSVIYKGGAVLAHNQWFAKRRAELVSILTKGTKAKNASSNRLENLSFRHSNFLMDQMHRISRHIVIWCQEHKVGTLVLGVNKFWKQHSHIGKANNQKFVSVPFTTLRFMITYKAGAVGIHVIEQEESYTSKADITAMDYIPVYGKDNSNASFSGRRIRRGLYKCSNGLVINADCNGAANIMRKAIPDIWEQDTDFRFLATPEVIGFHDLNMKGNPVKGIVA